jgi:predicted secreted protein
VPLAEITSIEGPGMTRETIDTTALDTSGGYRTFIAGFKDAGTITLNMNFTNATYTLIKGDFESNIPVKYQIVFPDTGNTTFQFEGLVTECPISIPTDDKITVSVTIKITGEFKEV